MKRQALAIVHFIASANEKMFKTPLRDRFIEIFHLLLKLRFCLSCKEQF